VTRKSIVLILIFQELGLILASAVWLFFRNLTPILNQGALYLTELNPFKGWQVNPESIMLGLGASLALLLISFIIAFTYEPFRKSLEALDSLILGKIKTADIIPIALLSGLGEEVFFRGILQEETGILFTSVCFALMHFPGKQYWIYSLWALFASLFLGNIYDYTHNLFIVIMAHVLNNLLALLLWQRYKNKIIGKSDQTKEL
jgi:membrane protease YdiL (CAAX protease family)